VPPSLASNAASLGRSCSLSAVNLNPNPAPDLACRTTASARICPSCTRKCSLASAPAVFGSSVSMNKPPMLMSRTCETSSRPLQCQYTHTSPGARTREVILLEGEVSGRNAGFPGTMVWVRGSHPSATACASDMTVVSKLPESFHKRIGHETLPLGGRWKQYQELKSNA